MLKGKCINIKEKQATFLFDGKLPKVNDYYHIEHQEGKSLELNGLFHAIIPEFYYWMFNKDQFIFDDGGITLDFRAANWYKLKDLLKQNYGEGNVYKYVNDKYEMEDQKDFYSIPCYVVDDFNNGNTKRIKLVLKSWGKYTPNQASKLVDIIFKLMDKLGVNTPKYLQIKEYLDKKDIEQTNKQNKEYTDKIKSKFC
jgi:hypothetical protein